MNRPTTSCVEIEDLRIYSCYYLPNDPYDAYLRGLGKLERSIGMAKRQLLLRQTTLIVSHWSGGRGDLI